MKIIKPLLCAFLVALPIMAMSQEENTEQPVTLTEYVDSYPNCLTQEVIYDGCTLKLNSDGDYLFGQFTILHPELQMRILMQGLHVYVDPTGKKKEKYSLSFPAASAVQEVMQHMAPSVGAIEKSENEIPDITPLVSALNEYGVEFEISNKKKHYEIDWASISVDPELHALTYSFIIPVEDLLKEKKLSDTWGIGLLSESGTSMNVGSKSVPGGMRGPGMRDPGMGRPGMGGPRMGGPGMDSQSRGMNLPEGKERSNENQSAADLRKMMIRNIESWTKFSFSELCSINE